MIGRIMQGIGSFYTVESGEESFVCKARGRFRKEHITPLIGDMVEFTPPENDDNEGSIDMILPRKNELLRPPLANIDLLFVACASTSPEPDLLLIDRLLVRARKAGIESAVVVNKTDLDPEMAENIAEQYRLSGYPVYLVCANSGEGIGQLKDAAKGKIIAFAGQSAVGKSSMMNALCPGLNLETGDLSRIERGRHTTRKASLIKREDGYLADTPGFSLLELDTFDPETLKECYPEFAPFEDGCRFLGCQHIGEPVCGVKEAAKQGKISPERLERYGILHDELKEKWGKRYD